MALIEFCTTTRSPASPCKCPEGYRVDVVYAKIILNLKTFPVALDE